ncbi:MAG: glutaredoxin family protein [Actinobacteria bacterium]|nr:glutaredoxin family protein [Actinomycetota bacterium]MBE3114739.1 glutaredoxin family protein [Actinomycetota bacterium]
MEVEIYTVKNCGDCKKIMQYLNNKKIVYTEHDMGIGGRPELQQMKKQFKEMGLKTYPVTIIKDKKVILQGFKQEEFDKAFGNE